MDLYKINEAFLQMAEQLETISMSASSAPTWRSKPFTQNTFKARLGEWHSLQIKQLQPAEAQELPKVSPLTLMTLT